ncbi:MAG: tyrosine-protein phosphatase [Tenacibaculum sp.]
MFFKINSKIPLSEVFSDNFVDIHSHLLPGIDDGAKNLDNSIELIALMSSYGIKNFVTTPHVLGDVYPNSSELIQQKAELLRQELQRRAMKDIKLQAAAEYMLDEKFLDRLSKNDILTISDNLVLVEMSYFNSPYNLYDILFEIQLKGYKPILAHPERYIFYHNDFQQYYKLKKAGCYFQLNFLSLTQHYGKSVKKTTQKILDQGLYDFVGTDTHHINHVKLLKKIATKNTLKKIQGLIKRNESLKVCKTVKDNHFNT